MGSIHKYKTKSGKPRWAAHWRDQADRQHKKVFKRRKAAAEFLKTTEAEVQEGSWRKAEPKPMREVFTLWAEELETRVGLGDLRRSTADTTLCYLRCHIAPEVDGEAYAGGLGAYRSDKLTDAVTAAWRAGMAKKVESQAISPKTFNNIHGTLTQAIRWARRRSFMTHDPMADQKPLRLRNPNVEFLDEDGIATLLAAVADDPEMSAVVHLGLFAGLRRGEMFGLQWGDIEAAGTGGRVNVRRSIYHNQVTETKTASSERVVDVPQSVIVALERHAASTPPMGEGFVFRTSKGTPHHPNGWYARKWHDVRERAELRESVGLHTLRHTYASLLVRHEGLKYASEQLGHSSVKITGDRYAHVLKSQRESAMTRLDETIRAAKRSRFDVVEGGRK